MVAAVSRDTYTHLEDMAGDNQPVQQAAQPHSKPVQVPLPDQFRLAWQVAGMGPTLRPLPNRLSLV